MAAPKKIIPRDLRAKVPSMLFMSLEQRTFWDLFSMGFCVFSLYGPVVGRIADHNGFRYLLGPLVCPIVPLLYYLLIPFNPYHGSAARLSGMVDKDKRDLDAKLLVELFCSSVARKFLLQATMKICGVLFVIMVAVSIACRNSLNWSLPSPWLGQGLLGCSIGSFITLGTEYVGWGLRTWATQSSGTRHEAVHAGDLDSCS